MNSIYLVRYRGVYHLCRPSATQFRNEDRVMETHLCWADREGRVICRDEDPDEVTELEEYPDPPTSATRAGGPVGDARSDSGGWLPWNSVAPLDPDRRPTRYDRVDVRLESGELMENTDPLQLAWTGDFGTSSIVAWRPSPLAS